MQLAIIYRKRFDGEWCIGCSSWVVVIFMSTLLHMLNPNKYKTCSEIKLCFFPALDLCIMYRYILLYNSANGVGSWHLMQRFHIYIHNDGL